VFLTLWFRTMAGFPFKTVTSPLPPFLFFEECIARGNDMAQEWLAHPRNKSGDGDWQEGGVRCSAAKPLSELAPAFAGAEASSQ
jgi:hypothetical protein